MADDLVEADTPAAVALLKDISKASGECLQNLRVLKRKINESASTNNQGISFLDVKNQLMSSYMANLGLLMDKKTCGKTVQNDPAIDRLVEIRTVLEKMRPIEHKLRYQINKVVSAFKEGKSDASDPRRFKANFGSFANGAGGDSSGEEDNKDKASTSDDKPKLYVPPKLAPVHYSDDETAEEKSEKVKKQASRKAMSTAMLKEIREQYTDAPMEIVESQDIHRMKANKREQEIIRYEEENFVRLRLSKKEMAAQQKMATMGSLGTLAEFGNFGGQHEDGPPKKKKKGLKGKKGKGKKGKKGGGIKKKRKPM